MDRKLLFKSNIMGNSAMRRNRAAKINSDRNLKRKELFSRGRDMSESPETQPTTKSTSAKNISKKSEEIKMKEEAYRARFMVYMQEKKQRLAKEKANKKPPFISAVGGPSTHIATQKPFEFVAPKPVGDCSNLSKPAFSSKKSKSEKKVSMKVPEVRQTRNGKYCAQPVVRESRPLRPRNVKINIPEKIKIDKNKLQAQEVILKETPIFKDKLFVFNTIGPVLTSTARKYSIGESVHDKENFETVFSPIDGIAPLELSVLAGENKENNLVEMSKQTPSTEQAEKLQLTQQKTPPKDENIKIEHFYLSPFVTTSRGKGSVKKEQRNRDSVYRLELNQSIEEPIEVRRRREAVKYFRKVLDDETNRLKGLCKTWDTYSHENAGAFEEHCTDMINVAVGQTNLLLSGKFRQFEKLVDGCEQFANECKDMAVVKSSQSNISPEDLEGYWNTVKIQIENVDRRFDNLTLWKGNDWQDPNNVPRQEQNIVKLLKPKKVKHTIKQKNEIQNLIKKARRELMINKINDQRVDQDIIFVSRRSHDKKERTRNSVHGKELIQLVEEPIEIRQRREAIQSFRKMLDDETSRLNNLCTEWVTCRDENAGILEEHCIDSINVAVGQTKLLLSGKFKQFEILVNDCEKFLNECKDMSTLLSSQSVSTEDLEGFWNIVKLQIENLDRRFDNLTSSKNNNWKDPDDKPKHKRNLLAKTMKPKKLKQKIKPKNEIKSLILKARLEYLKSKVDSNQEANQDIIFVPRRSQTKIKNNLSTPAKSSPAQSSRYVKTPYRTSITSKERQASGILTPAQRRLSVLRRTSIGNSYIRRRSETPKTSSIRKSILKSEIKRTQKKSVLFSEQIQYKSPDPPLLSSFKQFHTASKFEDSPRIMELRTRRIQLRDDLSD